MVSICILLYKNPCKGFGAYGIADGKNSSSDIPSVTYLCTFTVSIILISLNGKRMIFKEGN